MAKPETQNGDLFYEGTVEPLSDKAITVSGSTESFPFERTNDGDASLEVTSEGLKACFRKAGFLAFDVPPSVGKVDLEAGCIFECRLKLIRTENKIVPPQQNDSAVVIQMSESGKEDPGTWTLGFYTDPGDGRNYVVLKGNRKTDPYEIGNEFRTYRVVSSGDTIGLSVDGKAVGEVGPRKNLTARNFQFGNARGTGHIGEAVLEYLKITVKPVSPHDS